MPKIFEKREKERVSHERKKRDQKLDKKLTVKVDRITKKDEWEEEKRIFIEIAKQTQRKIRGEGKGGVQTLMIKGKWRTL